MIPLTKKQFKVFLLVSELVMLLLIIIGLILFNIWWAAHKVTPDMIEKNTEAMRIAESARHSIKDEALWKQASQEAALISKTIEDESDIIIFANYCSEDNEDVYGLVQAGRFSKKNNVERETLYYELVRSLVTATPVLYLKQKTKKVKLTSVELNWQDEEGEHHLVDANADGIWDDQPSD